MSLALVMVMSYDVAARDKEEAVYLLSAAPNFCRRTMRLSFIVVYTVQYALHKIVLCIQMQNVNEPLLPWFCERFHVQTTYTHESLTLAKADLLDYVAPSSI
jgi:hypothetical protein